MKRRILLPAIAIGVVARGRSRRRRRPESAGARNPVPTSLVTKGPLKLTVHAVGELRAGRTVTLVTPPVGGMLRIVTLMPTGMPVKAGEPVVEFDPADQQYALEQAKSELAEAEQEIVKMKADAAVQGAQDDVALLTARFDVRRAELDASGNEFIGALDAQKNVLSLEEARGALAQLQEDVKSRAATNQRVAGGRAGEADQGAARDAARAAGHRQPGDQGAVRRRRLAQGKPGRGRRDDLLGHGPARIPRRRSDMAWTSGRRRDRVRPDGGASQGRRERSRRTWWRVRPRSSRWMRSGRDVQGADRGARRPCEPRQFLGISRRHTAVRRDA